MPLELQHGMDCISILLQLCPSTQFQHIDDRAALPHDTSGVLDQGAGRLGGAAGGDQIVDHQHAFARAAGVHVHLDPVCAVLERAVLSDGPKGQLAWPALWHQPHTELRGQGRADDESAHFDAHNCVDVLAGLACPEAFDQRAQSLRIRHSQGGDVAEQDARFGMIWDCSDEEFAFHRVNL